MSENQKYHFETLQLHVGQEEADPATDARAVPIYQTTSYVFRNSKHAADRFGLRDAGNIYGRLTNPTEDVFEKRIAALEGGVGALAFASGAAAITTAVQGLVHNGQHIVASTNIYGGTYNLFEHTAPDWGISTTFVDSTKGPQVFEDAIQDNTQILYIESVGNPNADLIDIDAVAAIAHKHNIPLVVDNTFATPYLLRPIEHGADFAKDIGAAGYITYLRALLLRDTGATLAPFNAFLLLQGLETLSLRVERHGENALKVVDYLAKNPHVAKVNHPSLPSHPDHALYQKYFPHGGLSIFTFEIKGGAEAATKFIDQLKIFSLLANVADVKSLVIHPASTTHSQMSEEELLASGITPSTIRLSIGTEHIDDILADLDQAFKALD